MTTGEPGGRILDDFWRDLPYPAYILDCDQAFYRANRALAETFGYQSVEAAEAALAAGDFLEGHFSSEAISEFFEILNRQGLVENWLLCGETLDGRPLALEITAWGALRGARGPQLSVKAVFVPQGETRDARALLEKAHLEADQAKKAKNEFLANISHEFRTPLNIVIGMLALAIEDDSVSEEVRGNLALAKDGADRLFDLVNDLILLSNLEGGRLACDIAQFSTHLLLKDLVRQYESEARARKVSLRLEGDDHQSAVLEGGYNFLVLAMGKLVQNAIKFVDAGQGEAVLRATLETRADGPWLACAVSDNGPGLKQDILEAQELFRQGDSSMIRKHGGLGLGLRLTKNLVDALGGRLNLANRPAGGAEFSFSVPIKMVEKALG